MKAIFEKKTFQFKVPSGTSRGVLTEKHSWLITIFNQNKKGIGECSIIPGLSPEFIDFKQYEIKLLEVCTRIEYFSNHLEELKDYPSILFGVETGLLNMNHNTPMVFFQNSFTKGELKIPINGLVWMGSSSFMLYQVNEKIKEGYKCIKIKVGAINFEQECEVIKSIRNVFSEKEIEIRLDANGAFSESEVFDKLEYLSRFGIHSIEQPVKQGNWQLMKEVVEKSPIPIALDEELIGVTSLEEKRLLLETIRPNYIILKPSLHGGLVGTTEWIQCTKEVGIQWWITSALESNIGLSAICQFVSEFCLDLPQGLGTGSLYTNNINSNLVVSNGYIFSLKQ